MVATFSDTSKNKYSKDMVRNMSNLIIMSHVNIINDHPDIGKDAQDRNHRLARFTFVQMFNFYCYAKTKIKNFNIYY